MEYSYLQVRVFVLAFLTYFGYYVSREPYSLVKTTLLNTWAPFNGPDGWMSLGILDTVFLIFYAIGILIVGFLCEKFDCLYILVVGCIMSGVTTVLYGMADFWDVHDFWFFLTLRMLNGLSEACGWPTLVKMVDHYFCSAPRSDFIMAAFGSCKFFGIAIGSILSSFSFYFDDHWGYPFIWCGLVITLIGIIDIFLLPGLPPNMPPQQETSPILNKEGTNSLSAVNADEGQQQDKSTSMEEFAKALKLPGIIDYSFHLFCVKLSVYVVYYWLPTWLQTLTIQETKVTYNLACWFTAVWGIGGVIGTFMIGWFVYLTKMYGLFSFLSSVLAGSFVFLLFWYTGTTAAIISFFVILLLFLGMTQNAPYALSSSCMPSAINKLHSSRDSKLVGMATGIIDGFGSLGAIFGPLSGALILQYKSSEWGLVFLIVALAMFAAAFLLVWQAKSDVERCTTTQENEIEVEQ